MTTKKLFAFLGILFLFGFQVGCQSPTSSVQIYKDDLKKNYQKSIYSEIILDRKMNWYFVLSPNKPLIVFLHGSPGQASDWAQFLTDSNLQQHFSMLAVDRAGFGQSDPSRSEPNLKQQSDLVIEIIKKYHTGPQDLILMGHSFGGPLALEIALGLKKEVTHLYLLAASLDPNLEEILWYQHVAEWSAVKWILPTFLINCNQEILGLKPYLVSQDERWKELKALVTIFHGTLDSLVPFSNVAYIEKKLDLKFLRKKIIFENENHFLPWKRFNEIKTDLLTLSSP